MVQAFDFDTGLPRKYVRMESWPLMEHLSRPFWGHLGRAALESFVPTNTTEGFLVMFDRSVTGSSNALCHGSMHNFLQRCPANVLQGEASRFVKAS